MKKHGLTQTSHPIECINAAMATDEVGRRDKKIDMFQKWTQWTNMKAILMGAGDVLYPDFKPFTTKEIGQHVGLCHLNGIAPSPNIELKFLPTNANAANGNDIVNQCMPNGNRRHKHFKCFFSVTDPRIHPPPKTAQPNFKVDTFFQHVNQFSLEAWDPSPSLAVDEQVQMFTGRGSGTRRCNFKREGDGFFIDALCDDGCAITFCPRNQPSPRKCISLGYCPLHARVLFLLDQLEQNSYHKIFMDDLFTSKKLAIGAKTHTRSKCDVHGVCRANGRGLPKEIFMENPTNAQARNALVGTTKAAVFKSEEQPDIAAFAAFD